eukprot:scaffold4092_cov271-Prasinococcus_capsulatus_cf.AAC.1
MRANPLPDPWREAAGPRRRAGESGAELAAVRTAAGAPPPESNLAEPLAKEPPDLSTATVTTQAGPEPSDGPHAEQVEQELPRPARPRKRPPGQRPGAADRHAQPDADGESDRCDQTPKACRADVPAAAEAPLRKSRSASSSSSGSLESSVASLDGTVLAGAPARRDQVRRRSARGRGSSPCRVSPARVRLALLPPALSIAVGSRPGRGASPALGRLESGGARQWIWGLPLPFLSAFSAGLCAWRADSAGGSPTGKRLCAARLPVASDRAARGGDDAETDGNPTRTHRSLPASLRWRVHGCTSPPGARARRGRRAHPGGRRRGRAPESLRRGRIPRHVSLWGCARLWDAPVYGGQAFRRVHVCSPHGATAIHQEGRRLLSAEQQLLCGFRRAQRRFCCGEGVDETA